ncbi:MAG: hypothetical protein ABT05_00920 [Lautropia sp. SCN 66-9]|nr:MAG: hypothetical protein ABT05_00920 [Lautropia sp. SCN 66-9]
MQASSEARKATAAAMSSAVWARRIGTSSLTRPSKMSRVLCGWPAGAAADSSRPMSSDHSSVQTKPGQTAFTVTPYSARSRAITRVSVSIAILVTL